MRSNRVRVWSLATAVAACGASAALAQINFIGDPNLPGGPRGGEVNFSGATLFRPFFFTPAATNDFIDVDGDGFAGYDPLTPPFVDQLAAPYGGGSGLTTFWALSYRSVGSINGFGEFVTYQNCGLFRGTVPSEDGFLNRFAWATGGVKQNGPGRDCLYCDPNRPVLFDVDDPNLPLYPEPSNIHGCQVADGLTSNDDGSPFCRSSVDGAAIDVPGLWAVRAPGSADPQQRYWGRGPTQNGYGVTNIPSNTGYVNALQQLTRVCDDDCEPNTPKITNSLNTNDPPDDRTIFDTVVAWGPIVYIANRGVGRPNYDPNGADPVVVGNHVGGDIRLTDVRHLMVAGRLRHGENLAGATRSAGSGTRNGIMNTTGIDPAWGRGDNLDNEYTVTNDAHLGAGRKVTNAEGSSGVERATQVSRLGIGYTGLAGNERAAFDAVRNRYEILNVRFDDRDPDPSTGFFVRPNPHTVVYNASPDTGWQLGGEVTLVTVGDPFQDNPAAPEYMEARPAVWFLRNIVESIQAFTSIDPNNPDPNNFFMPGEYLALTYFLASGIGALPSTADPEIFVPQVPPAYNAALAAYMSANNKLDSGDPNGTPDYGSKSAAGIVPTRKTKAGGYLDGQTSAYLYRDNAGVNQPPIAGGAAKLAERNQVQGDFNRDRQRNINDIWSPTDPTTGMMRAFTDPLNYEVGKPYMAGSQGDQTVNAVIVHVIGDFDGNGDFDAEDVRYFADGLALDPNTPALDPADVRAFEFGNWLNRKAGFVAVDLGWNQQVPSDTNFFNTTLATPKTYASGDSRGDIAGDLAGIGVVGADPRGADGIIDARDIDAVYAAFKNEYLGFNNTAVDWYNLDQAVYSDLSADMTGAEIVAGRRTILIDQKDVDELVQVILGTTYGDVNLDGAANAADCAIIEAHLGQAGGWAQGDVNGDGIVDNDDQVLAGCAAPAGCPGDADCDGDVDFFDIDAFVARLGCPGSGPACNDGCRWQNSDVDDDGDVDFFDIDPFVARLGQICP
jgi:hypothetical protein